jgi:hypothetical protein
VSVEARRVRHSLDEDGRAKSEATSGRRRDSGSKKNLAPLLEFGELQITQVDGKRNLPCSLYARF